MPDNFRGPRRRRASLALFAAALLACGSPAHRAAPGAARAAAGVAPRSSAALTPLPPLTGFWASEGYGYQFEVTAAGELVRNQVTSLSCIPTWHAKRVARDAASATYQQTGAPPRFVIRGGGDPDEIRIQPDASASAIVARRLPGRLAVCERATPDTPRSSFNVFAATWSENYGFFDLARTDWEKVVAVQRAKVTAETSPAELFAILKGMIEPLEDAHSSLFAPTLDGDGRGYAGFRVLPGHVEPPLWDQARASVGKYLASPLREPCNKQIGWGMLAPDVAYLRVRSFADYAPGGFEGGLAAEGAALDAFFENAPRWRGLVIDVRLNEGGYDPYALALASRLTGSSYVAYAKQARSLRSPSGWTAEQPITVTPGARPGYPGPLVVLIGPDTISAGETFVQALLERAPHVARVGQRTQGVFSDVMGRRLPNGWTTGVPNERYVTRGKSYDVTGIPPSVEVPVYAEADVAAGRDVAVEAALRILQGEQK